MRRAHAVAAVLCAASLGAAAQHSLRGTEGPLDNDSFLPADPEATAALAGVDRKLIELARSAPDDSNRRAWLEVLDGLHLALRDSRTGDMVAPLPQGAAGTPAWPDPDGTADPKLDRRRDGVEGAVRRRLRTLDAGARALWRERYGALGDERLARGPVGADTLREVERNYPWTRAAALAALRLGDAALERAAPSEALGWLERAEEHAREGGAQDLLAALELRRRLALEERETLHPRAADELWQYALGVLPIGSLALDELAQRMPRVALDPGLGIRPGLCFLDGGRAALQVPGSTIPDRSALSGDPPDRLVLVDLAQAARLAVVTPALLFEPLGVQAGYTARPVEPPGWPLLPASDGRRIVLTIGRRSFERDNVLACVEFVEVRGSAEPPRLRLLWAWHGGRQVAGPLPPAAPLEWPTAEFQPGTWIADGMLYALVREFADGAGGEPDAPAQARSSSEIRTWLAAFDLESGALAWRTWLGKGLELQRSRGRLFNPQIPTAAAQPLAALGARLFAGSHTGYGALLDTLDGRVDWALRYRRRQAERRTWTGAQPAADPEQRALVWAPADSDHLYWLRGEPDLDGQGLLLAAPRAAGEAEVLLGGGRDSAVVLTRVGAGRAAASWDARSGRTALAPDLGPAETFAGDGLVSAERAWFASTRGLYLLDRTRELFLLDYAQLKLPYEGLQPGGGSLFARDAWVCVLGGATLWVFQARL